jgi:hypothetical protein
MVAEMVENSCTLTLQTIAAPGWARSDLVLWVFDRYPRPESFAAATWNEARQDHGAPSRPDRTPSGPRR